MKRNHLPKKEQGTVTVFFVMTALMLVGVITYSLYVGRAVEQKIKVDTTADLAAVAMADHAALGLNLMAVNNLATAGNLHVAAAVPFLGRYEAILKAYLVRSPDDIEAVAALTLPQTADGTKFADGFRATATMTGLFLQAAVGLTKVNKLVAQDWTRIGVLKGVEAMRLNSPGAVGLPMQVSAIQSGQGPSSLYRMALPYLALTSPESAMCHSLRSSERLKDTDRNTLSFWLGGVLESFKDPTLDVVVKTAKVTEGTVRLITDTIQKAVAPVATAVDILSKPCKLPIVPPGMDAICSAADAFTGNIGAFINPPMPSFVKSGGCGLTISGDLDKQMRGFFGDAGDGAIGFVYPNVTPDTVGVYQQALQFAALVGQPEYQASELPRTPDGKSPVCPAVWQFTANGHQYCSVFVDGLDQGRSARGDQEWTGQLSGSWARVQWAIGQAKAEYEPSPDDGNDDHSGPIAALSTGVDPSKIADVAAARRRQLFWPAWRGRQAEPTVLSQMLGFLVKKS